MQTSCQEYAGTRRKTRYPKTTLSEVGPKERASLDREQTMAPHSSGNTEQAARETLWEPYMHCFENDAFAKTIQSRLAQHVAYATYLLQMIDKQTTCQKYAGARKKHAIE